MNTTGNQAEKKPKLEINRGVELMLRNKKTCQEKEGTKVISIYFWADGFFLQERNSHLR